MKVLVTGGCGFIGSHIVDRLVEAGHTVAVADNLSTGNLKNLNSSAKLYKVDITSPELNDVFSEFKPEAVYHEAAQIDVQTSLKNPVFDAMVNVAGSVNVLNCVKNNGVGKIIYASSAAVYGNPEYMGVDEKHKVEPLSFYGISKHTPEHYIKAFSNLFGFKYTILRYANVYGIRQEPKGEGGVISIFISKILKNEVPTIFGDGEQTRDFIYVNDIASANIKALTAGDNEIINVSTNRPVTVNRLFGILKEVSGTNLSPEHAKERKGDIHDSYLDNSKAHKLLGFSPQYTLEQGLKETYEYYAARK